MANDKKFIVKNGLQTSNVSFKDSNESLNEITVEMLGTDTLSFSGDVGQLLSLTDTPSGTILSANDASGNPSIEVDADGDVRIAEVSGNLSIGTDSSRGFNVYVDGTFRADSADIAIVNGTATNADNVKITNDTSTNSTHYVHFGDATSGYDGVKVSSSKLTFNPSSGALEVNGLSVATTADLTAATSPSFSVDSANFGTANSFTIGEGKAVYYDTGTSKWEGAYNDSTGDYTASHVIIDMTSTDVKIASTGIFTLSGGLSANNYYFLSSTAGTATNNPDSAPTAWQPLYYALDANQIDLQIQTPEDTVITTFGSDGTIQGQSGGGMNDVVEDTTPQLGGNLDLNSKDITGTGNINITGNATLSGDLTVNDITGAGNITLDSDLIFTNRVQTDGRIKLWNGSATNGYAIGIESGTLYNRSAVNHRWYINTFADGGTSDYMELTTTGLDVPSGTIQDAQGDVRTPLAGEVVQSVSATTGFGTTKQVINSSSKVAVTGLSVTITPKYSNSKMLISGYLHSSATYVMGFAIYKNGSSLITGNTQSNQTGGSVNLWTSYGAEGANESFCFPYPFRYQDTVSNTNATTYQIYANSGWGGGTNNLHINDRSSDDMRSQSWITVQEIKV